MQIGPVIEEVWARRLGARPVAVTSVLAPLRWVRSQYGNMGVHVRMETRLFDGQRVRAEVEVVKTGLVGDALIWPFVAITLVTAVLAAIAVRWALHPLDRLAAGAVAIGRHWPPLAASLTRYRWQRRGRRKCAARPGP